MAGKLQDADHKSESEIIAAGGAKSGLLNDTKVYVTGIGINETLDDAFATAKHLMAPQIATPSSPASGYDRLYPKSDDRFYMLNSAGSEKAIVTPASTDQLTNKDIDGGTASNSNRITLPKASTSTLNGLTRKQGTVAYDTTQNKVVFDDGSVLTAVGTGSGSGVPNYITNWNAETDTTGWSTFDDGAVSTPVDGTGGSPSTLTFTQTTTGGEVLSGTGSFKLAKSAANGQGEGVSYAFTVDRAGAAYPTRISFNYQTTANFSYTNNDIVVYIYDVSASSLIQPTPYTLDGSGKFVGDFQTNSNASTSYRLIFMVATTNASAYDFIFDNVIVYAAQPSSKVEVVVAKYTNLVAGSYTTSAPLQWNTKDTDTHGAVTTGSSWKFTAPVSGYYLVSGLSDSNVTSNGVYIYKNGSQTVAISQGTGSGHWITLAGGIALNAGDYIDIRTDSATVSGGSSEFISISKVTGPASSLDTADGRIVAALITGDPASASSGNPIIVPTVSYDSHAAYNASSGRYTCPISGIYKVYGALQSASSATTLTVYVDAVSTSLAGNLDSNGEATFNTAVKVNAGQIIDLRPGGTVDATNMTLNFERISGPAQPTSKEFVVAKYQSSSATSVPNDGSFIVLDYNIRVFDSHSAVTTGASWKFTCPVSGYYFVSAYIWYANATWSTGNYSRIQLYKNGSADMVYYQNIVQNGFTNNFGYSGGVTIKLNAGDYIQIVADHNRSGGAVSTYASEPKYNTVDILKVG